jgi:hypothetical protein
MSTASRYCGTVCSARGGRLNAAHAPGVSGTTRGHYDPRAHAKADGQLGNPGCEPQWMWPKFTSEAEIAAPWSSGFSPSLFLFRQWRQARLRQSPPFLSRWHPPPKGAPMHQPTEREKPFKACPDLSCRRINRCQKLAPRKNCLKTHFRNDDEWFDYMAARINRLCKGAKSKRDPNDTRSDSELMAEFHQALVERLEYLEGLEARKN